MTLPYILVGFDQKKPTQKIEWENCYEKEKVWFKKNHNANIYIILLFHYEKV